MLPSLRRVATLMLFALLTLLSFASCAHGQVFDASSLREPASPETGWLVHAGDDPAYARPTSTTPVGRPSMSERNRSATSCTAAGPRSSGTACTSKSRPPSAASPSKRQTSPTRSRSTPAASSCCASAASIPSSPTPTAPGCCGQSPKDVLSSASVVLAIRIRLAKNDWESPFPALYYSNLSLGQEHELHQGVWLTLLGDGIAGWTNDLFAAGLGLVALLLFLAQRHRREYLWIFLTVIAILLEAGWSAWQTTHTFPEALQFVSLPFYLAELLFELLLFFAFLRLPIPRWLWISTAIAAGLMTAEFVGFYILRITSRSFDLIAYTPSQILLYGVIPVLLLRQWRKGNREAGILLIPVLFRGLASYANLALGAASLLPGGYAGSQRIASILFAQKLGPVTISLYDIGDLLFNLSLTLIVVLRATRTSREQALLEGELEACRGVQQIIVPEHVESVPGFTVESAYRPAQQVGGDFFQILTTADGALLVVVGDVAGKGLPAAMLVSVLVGAIRGAAPFTNDPAELLANLNQRLLGRMHGGFATALVARIAADGEIVIANAGHLSPYLDGEELDLPGALPLGVDSDPVYCSARFFIENGSRIAFCSDGVIEAMNGKGELFGFERTRAISDQGSDVILQAALSFGQQDDITVITIARAAKVLVAA